MIKIILFAEKNGLIKLNLTRKQNQADYRKDLKRACEVSQGYFYQYLENLHLDKKGEFIVELDELHSRIFLSATPSNGCENIKYIDSRENTIITTVSIFLSGIKRDMCHSASDALRTFINVLHTSAMPVVTKQESLDCIRNLVDDLIHHTFDARRNIVLRAVKTYMDEEYYTCKDFGTEGNKRLDFLLINRALLMFDFSEEKPKKK